METTTPATTTPAADTKPVSKAYTSPRVVLLDRSGNDRGMEIDVLVRPLTAKERKEVKAASPACVARETKRSYFFDDAPPLELAFTVNGLPNRTTGNYIVLAVARA